MTAPRVCLNMIVRNEAAIIERCLASLLPAIDHFVICDTGSDDDTVPRIHRFMQEHGINGSVHGTVFRDFGSARNEALDLCRAERDPFDYILFTDADMELQVGDRSFRDRLTAPAYSLRQQSSISYFNTRLVRRDVAASYVGLTHEYLSVQAPVSRLDSLWFVDHACGSSRAVKFERDLRLLHRELELDPSNTRSMFYLAQTYRDCGDLDRAVEWYERRAAAGGWDQEAWYARYSAAICRVRRGEKETFVEAALAAFASRPSRAEPLMLLAQHYLDERRQDDAVTIAEVGAAIPLPTDDMLFIHDDVYRGAFDEAISIGGFYSSLPSRQEKGRRFCARLATDRGVPVQRRSTARHNLVHYARGAAEEFGRCAIHRLDLATEPGWNAMNPSILRRRDGFHAIIRTVDFRYDGNDYVMRDGRCRTRNLLARLEDDFSIAGARELVEAPGGPPVNDEAFAIGAEDCRLFEWRGRLCVSFTMRDRNADHRCEIGFAELADDGTFVPRALRGYEDRCHQKNWLPLVRDGELLFVYSSDPFVVLRYDGERLQEVVRHAPPLALDHLRGGSQVIPIDGGWIYLTHEVVFSGKKRTYLHRFVALDDDLRLTGVTNPFWFRERTIEFVAGLARDGNRLCVSFGWRDSEAFIAELDLDAVLRAMRVSF